MGSSTLLSRLSILGAALLFSTGGAAIKGCGLSGWQVACFRSLVAAVVLWLLLPAARRGWSARTPLVAVAYAATLVLFVLANKLTTAASSIFLQSTAPLYVLLAAPLLLQERVALRDVIFMVLIGSGLALFFVDVEPSSRIATDPLLGNILGAASGVTWALTLMGLRWLERDHEAGRPEAAEIGAGQPDTSPRKPDGSSPGLGAVVLGNLLACAVCLPQALPIGGSSAVDWALVAYLGVFQIGLAYVLLTRGFRRVPALEASLLILLEPALNPLWTWLLQDEVPGSWAIVGGVLILLASAGNSWQREREGATGRAGRRP